MRYKLWIQAEVYYDENKDPVNSEVDGFISVPLFVELEQLAPWIEQDDMDELLDFISTEWREVVP